MAITNLTGTTWNWNYDADPSFEGSGGFPGTTKHINFVSHGDSFSSMTFENYHGGDINSVSYDNTVVWYSDIDSGNSDAVNAYRQFTITGGADVSDSTLIDWITNNATEVVQPHATVDLSTLSGWSSLTIGSHTLTAKAKATGYIESALSTGVTFTKAATGYTVRVTGQVYAIEGSEAAIVFYDGQDDSGIELVSCSASDGASNSFDETVLCTTGYIYAGLYHYGGGGNSTYGTPSSGITHNGSGLYTVTADGSITGFYCESLCLTGDTLITMADGSAKRLDEINLGDEVLSVDWQTQELIPRKVIFTDKDAHKSFTEYDKWIFEDGTEIKTVHGHEFYNVEKGGMTYMDNWDIGDHAYKIDGTKVALVSHETIQEQVNHYKITLEDDTNYFANGLLNGDRNCPKIVLNSRG